MADPVLDPEVAVPLLVATRREHRYRGRITVTTGVCDCGVELTATGGPVRDAAARVADLHDQHVAEAQLAALTDRVLTEGGRRRG